MPPLHHCENVRRCNFVRTLTIYLIAVLQVKLARQKSDITELESLCSFLEDKAAGISSY
jgi:hypothetical protein